MFYAYLGNIGTENSPFGIRSPNATTVFPNQMEVDWIRVYQRTPQANLTDLCGTRGIEGNSLLCSGQQLTYNFTGVRTDAVTWRVSPNLQIVSQTNFSVTVQPINSTVNSEEWINGATSAYDPCPETTFVKNISNLERGVYYVICVLKDKNEIISQPLIIE